MDLVPKKDVDIKGETFDLVSIPAAGSEVVKSAKDALLGSLDLQSLVEDLGKLGNFIRVAYNGVAGCTEVQIKVQRVGYKITKLADKSAVTVHKFKGASQSVLQELQGTYQYLLDGLEVMALHTLSHLTTVAKDMAAAADELHRDFEQATEDVIEALEDTQREKGSQEKREKAREKERKEFERKQEMAVQQQKNALESEEKAQALYNEAQRREDEAQKREDKAMDDQRSLLKTLTDVFTGVADAAVSAAKLDLDKALEKLADVGGKSVYKMAMKMANKEKMKQLEELQKQRDLRHEAIVQCIEFAEKIKNCEDDGALAEAAIEALHSSVGELKSLSTTMMKAAEFWEQMQIHCESLATGEMQQSIEDAMKSDEATRLDVWTSDAFKTKALQYYSKWVALDDVCRVYMLQIKNTKRDLYKYLEENPTIEQARSNVRRLAATFADDLKKAKEKLAQEDEKALEEKKSLEDSA